MFSGKKICISGNSVGLRVRDPIDKEKTDSKNFSGYLESDGYYVINKCRAGVMIDEAYGLIEEDILSHNPDYIILCFGIVEVSKRRTIRSIQNATIHNYYLNSIRYKKYNYNKGIQKIENLLFRIINGLTRRFAEKFNINWQWMSNNNYSMVLNNCVGCLLKETNAKIIVLKILNPGQRIENKVPGTMENVQKVNLKLQKLKDNFVDSRVLILDLNKLIRNENLSQIIPDGIHLSGRGHEILANSIDMLIKSNNQ